MFRRFSINFAVFSMALDSLLVATALFIAAWIRPALSRWAIAAFIPPGYHIPPILYILFPFIWVAVLLLLQVYDGRKNMRINNELGSLTLGSLLAIVSMAGTLYLSYREVSRLMFISFAGLAYLGMVVWRLGLRWFMVARWQLQERRVLIAGAGPVGRQLQEQIQRLPVMGLKVAGFLDDDAHKRAASPEILGTLEDARRLISAHQIDDVVIALPSRAFERINHLVAELHDLPVKVWVIPDYFQLALHKAVVEDFAGLPMLDLRAPALNDYQRMTKRVFDLLIVLLTLPVAAPLTALIALAIRLETPGPAIFHQQRVGENGRLFEVYKFRTMVANAEELRHLVERYDEGGRLLHKAPDDPRVTRLGRFLRRASLDELPQLFNILKGEMSLVGPRPELPYLVDQYEPWQRKRFAVPPGLTGWWQINGRSDRPMHLHTEDDLYYVQHYSLLLDLQILFKTVWVVFMHKGAY